MDTSGSGVTGGGGHDEESYWLLRGGSIITYPTSFARPKDDEEGRLGDQALFFLLPFHREYFSVYSSNPQRQR